MQQETVSGLHISPFTLGTVQLGMDYGIANKQGRPDQDASFSILRNALEAGVCSFDTAHAYGESEQVLGSFFTDKDKATIITKSNPEYSIHTSEVELEKNMYCQVETSLTHLKINKLPALLIHNPDILLRHGTTVTAVLKKMRSEGLVDKAGVSFGANTDEQLQAIWDFVKDELYEVVQFPINILDHRMFHNGGFQKLKEAKKIVFARSIFLQGVLFFKADELPAHLVEAYEPLRILQDISFKSGLSIAQLAVSFIRDLDVVHSLVIGVENLEQLISTLSLMEGPELPEQVRQECMQRLAQVPEKVVNTLFWSK
ncbi:Predicted oxidoreductase [Virgibacillus subterraneus]|uniref:Predicted oxidoreductase n=1 Tax=Virgibacillus subterraneus TaxID=621109 RepID=A0A1H9G709_9BACI|nr:aldo/keto reductase [Virgibacillus subterraneus]SEQ45881.1 Predicted oxidoreductase [Virgibacillus subterraneus]